MDEINKRLAFIDQRMKTNDMVLGEIYVITNKITGAKYVGQALSHRLNTGFYKPFGYIGRYRDHISEAMCNTKKKQCTFLNNAIRKYGHGNFEVRLIKRCLPEESNDFECEYIKEYNTLYPNGYNLTTGGRFGQATVESKKKIMEATHNQYKDKKLEKFKGVQVDLNKLDSYIREYKSYGETYYKVIVGNKSCIFVGKHLTPEELKTMPYEFLKQVALNNSATQPNCGNTLTASDTHFH